MTIFDPSQSNPASKPDQKIAVLLPCYNEELTIGKVVDDFRKSLPKAIVYVFDNNSEDKTAQAAAEAGAVVVRSQRQGKGHVVKHMFREIDADVYVMADGDDTYPADQAPELIRVLEESDADMVVGTRLKEHDRKAFRSLHIFGNKIISKLISTLFSSPVTDVLSGYRAFNKHFVKTLYLRSSGFEVETEMTLQALIRNCVVEEVPVQYSSRPPGSVSKLNTFSDGMHILKSVFLIFRDYKPLVFFTSLSALCLVLGLAAGRYPIADYLETRYVSHVPLALLAAAFVILAVLFLGIGLILNAIAGYHMENQELVGNLYRLMRQSRDRD
jgi:glycosyltransferase involved in cell wall biosynthesis